MSNENLFGGGGYVAAGAACGATLRYYLGEYGKRRGWVPHTTLLINTMGSFVLGGLVGAAPPTRLMLFAGTGFCGGFTTFSTYSVEMMKLVHTGKVREAIGYVVFSNVLSIGAAAVGMRMGSSKSVTNFLKALK